MGAGGAFPSTETCTRAIHQDSVICCIACPDRRGTMAAATLYTAHLSSWPGPPSPSCVYAHCSHLLNSACMRRIYFLQMFWVNFFSLLDIIVFGIGFILMEALLKFLIRKSAVSLNQRGHGDFWVLTMRNMTNGKRKRSSSLRLSDLLILICSGIMVWLFCRQTWAKTINPSLFASHFLGFWCQWTSVYGTVRKWMDMIFFLFLLHFIWHR